MKNLDVGCGIRPMTGEEWETLDMRSAIKLTNGTIFNPDIVANILTGIPRPNETYDLVRLSSVLEHFSKRENNKIIDECYRVLKPNGVIWISVPDMMAIAEYLLEENKVFQMMNFIYGEQDYEGNLHKWGYTNTTLSELLESKGFKDMKQLPKKQYDVELVMEAIK